MQSIEDRLGKEWTNVYPAPPQEFTFI